MSSDSILTAPALAGTEARTAAPGPEERPRSEEVRLNPIGEWTLAFAWIALVAINLWTWRMILKKRDGVGKSRTGG